MAYADPRSLAVLAADLDYEWFKGVLMAYANPLRSCPTCWGYETRECLSGRHPRRCPKCLPDQCCPIWAAASVRAKASPEKVAK